MSYQIEMNGPYALYSIKKEGQGPVPSVLKGLYTTKQGALDAIDSYERQVTGRIRRAKTKRNTIG